MRRFPRAGLDFGIKSLGLAFTWCVKAAEAKREATRDGAPPIELIDGEKLIDMLEKLELGLKPVTTFEVEHPFFDEFKA